MRGERVTKKVYKSDVDGKRDSGRPGKSGLNGVKKACYLKSWICMDREQ